MENHTSSKTIQLIVFKLSGQNYALPIEEVREVVLTPNISRVPLTPDYIRGVSNIRGNIFAIIDLEIRFQLSEQNTNIATEHSFTLVLSNEELRMGVLVKEVPNTLAVNEKEVDLSPNLIKDNISQKDFIKGIVKYQEQIILLIDVFKLVDKEDFKTIL